MLVWKTQTLNVNVASLRYRCLLPVRYLEQRGIASTVCSDASAIKLTPRTQAIVFVKSFRTEDVAVCEQAYQLGVPIILDLCDNILIDEYAADTDYVPAQNFRRMLPMAAVVVTTGSALQAEVETAVRQLNLALPVVVIPDGNETLSDIEFAFKATRWQRIRKNILWPVTVSKRKYSETKRKTRRQAKQLIYSIKGQVGDWLRRHKLALPKTASAPPSAPPSAPSPVVLSARPLLSKRSEQTQTTPLQPARWPEAAIGVKTVLWFGNHGAKYGNFGMANILNVAPALEALSHEQPLRLMVVSNSYEKYEQCIAPLPFETGYLPWHPRKIYDYIQASDVVIIPNSQSVYSICKSANRAVLTLSQGTPVVASSTPALNLFAECIWLDDWETGLRTYLLSPEVGAAHVAQAQQLIAQHLSGEVIAQQWQRLLRQINLLPKREASQAEKILLLINLPQDLDMLLPLALRLQKSTEYCLEVAVTDKVIGQSPRVSTLLGKAGIEPTVLNHKAVVSGLQPRLAQVRAVVTASETTANAHKGPHKLTQRANQQGILTYTLQHGFENVGINYFDAEYPVGSILFASKTIFTWGAIAQLPPQTPPQTKAKCVAVGCPKFIDAPGLTVQIPGHPAGNRLIVVFENLHWSRYSDDYRQRFLQDLAQSAIAYPAVTFLVKPHHTGLWLTQRYQGQVPVARNLIIADPKAPEWEVFTAPALIEVADLVITTPSTVAVDAARAACPVAVVAYELDLPNFAPLPLLRSGNDWRSLVAQAENTEAELAARVDEFVRDRLIDGDAVERITRRIFTDLTQHCQTRLSKGS